MTDYPPRYRIDLHEDDLIHEGYACSQGARGAEVPLATASVFRPTKSPSVRLLEKLGLRETGRPTMPGEDEELALCGMVFDTASSD